MSRTEASPLTQPAMGDLLSCPGRAHLVGAAGSGMRALADVLAAAGWWLTGSDAARRTPGVSPVPQPSASSASEWVDSHHADNVPPDADLLIHSAAVPLNNPEIRRALQQGIPVIDYPEALGRLSRHCATFAVAGTHGKSTTVAMAKSILTSAGGDPTVIGGATPLGWTSGGRLGSDGTLLVEACEYRRHFLHLTPRIAVLLPIESDHFDCYPNPASLAAAFRRFVERVAADGRLLVAADCRRAQRAARSARCPVETFGCTPEADYSARSLDHKDGRYRFAFCHRGERVVDVALNVPGRHQVQNALAAAALAMGCWQDASGTQSPHASGPPVVGPFSGRARPALTQLARGVAIGLGRFAGLRRRLEDCGTHGGVRWIDDYAHHPTELRAAVSALRTAFPGRTLTGVFQPHQATRTVGLFDAFVTALRLFDRLAVAEIFRAREGRPRPDDVTADILARAVRACGSAKSPAIAACHQKAEIARWLRRSLQPGEVLLTAGAGDVDRIGRLWADLARPPSSRRRSAGSSCADGRRAVT